MSELARVDLKPIENKLAILSKRAEAIVVIDQESYALACKIVLEGRNEVKAIGFVLDPGIQSAKEHLEKLRNDKAAFVNRVTPIVQVAEQKAEAWKAEERRKAKQEEDRINEQRRIEAQRKADAERREAEVKAKADREQRERDLATARKKGEINKREQDRLAKQAAEDERKAKDLAAKQAQQTAANVQPVKVKPSVPVVSGIKARVNWKFKVINADKVRGEFLMPNEVAIGAAVRDIKDKAKAEEAVGGIEVWHEDSI
jgi:colicin import membrane protein